MVQKKYLFTEVLKLKFRLDTARIKKAQAKGIPSVKRQNILKLKDSFSATKKFFGKKFL